MSSIFKNSKTICFTGHRPPELGGYDWNNRVNKEIMKALHECICDCIMNDDKKKIRFIVGGALGIDQMAFEMCYLVKRKFPKIKISIEIAVPVKNMESKWFKREDLIRFKSQMERADKITKVYTLDKYKNSKKPFQARNEYMVDQSDEIIAVYNNKPYGGTKNCIDYANKLDKSITYINPDLYK